MGSDGSAEVKPANIFCCPQNLHSKTKQPLGDVLALHSNIPRGLFRILHFLSAQLVGCCSLLLLGACSPLIRTASFPARPETVAPADLLGPYDGVVLDAETSEPLRDALVVGSWRFTRGIGLRGPAGGKQTTTRTNADGRYQISALAELASGLSTDVSAFTLIVYKQGYQAYRSDREMTPHGLRPRRGFSQREQRIELARLGSKDRHVDQLALLGFWGGTSEMMTASEWEVEAALTQAKQVPQVVQVGLDSSRWLTIEDVRTATGYGGGFEARKLREPQSETSATTDTHHLRAVDQPERFDVAIRVWRVETQAEQQYEKLLRTYPGAMVRDEMMDRSFRAAEGEILALGVLDRSRGLTFALTCGVGLCPDHEVLLKIASQVLLRIAETQAP